jgi:hypothetical protein
VIAAATSSRRNRMSNALIFSPCHCEKRRDDAIHLNFGWIAAVGSVSLAMTNEKKNSFLGFEAITDAANRF